MPRRTVSALFLVLLSIAPAACIAAPAVRAGSDQPPLGLWSYAKHFDTGPGGMLALSHRGDAWTARIGKATATAIARDGDVRIAFANGDAFRGVIGDHALRGFWIRRPVVEDPRFPFGQAMGYATPLDLRPAGNGAWRARVAPLADTFTLYLAMFRDADGKVRAAFRNPEQNSYGTAMQYDVTRHGDVLALAPAAPSQEKTTLEATLRDGGARIALDWKDMGGTIVLQRTSPATAASYFPRLPGSARYAYRMPADIGDGWKVARAGNLGMDEAALARMVQRIVDMDPAGARAWPIHSVAIAYKGRLVLDEYFHGQRAGDPHDTRSASKTFSSVILGAARREGATLDPASRVYEVMARRGPFDHPDPRKANITLGHLLTHSAGFACDDNAEDSPGNEDMMESDRSRPDWTKRTLDLPMAFEPGAHYAYCSMNINLAGAMLSEALHAWLPDLFDRLVARPLQFGPYHWNLQGTGEGYLGGGVFVRPRDFLKVGQAYLDGGTWNGRRIVDAAWVKDSLAPHARISPATTGMQGDAFANAYWETDEGWAWHMINVRSGDRTFPAFHANGNGGQMLLLLPQFDLAVMFTAGGYGTGLWNRERDELVGGMILPAIRGAALDAARPPGEASLRH